MVATKLAFIWLNSETVGILQGAPKLDDLFGDRVVQLAALDQLERDQRITEQATLAGTLLRFLVGKSLLQVRFGNEAFLDEVLAQTRNQDFRCQWSGHLAVHPYCCQTHFPPSMVALG
jgi:hypothetical protein